MKNTLMLFSPLMLVAACSSASSISLEPEATPSTYTLRCAEGWADCYVQANRICGQGGFEELDRLQTERLTSSGRSVGTKSEPIIRREDNRSEVESRVLTIRCR